MNSPKPLSEIVGDENKENAIASIPKSTNIQEPSSTVKPGTSPNDTTCNNNDDEVDTTAHPSSVVSRFVNILHSPPARRSTGKNVGDLKRPAEVTPVPSSTSVAKRSRHVTPKRIAKLATEPVSASGSGKTWVKRQSSPKKNFFQDVYDLLEQSSVTNPDLIRWTEDGTAFFYDDKNIEKLSQWLIKFELPKWESFRRRLNVYGFCKGRPLRNKTVMYERFHRGLDKAGIDRLYQLHLDGASVRSTSKASMKKKAAASTRTLATTSTASEKVLKALQKSSADVTPKPSGGNEAPEHSEVTETPLNFTADVLASQSNEGFSVTTPVAVKHPTSYSPDDLYPLPLGMLMDAALGYSQMDSLPFDSEIESTAAGGTFFTKQVSSAPFVSPTGCIPVELGLDHYEKILSLDDLVSPCKCTKKAQYSIASPTAGPSLANLTHDQGIHIKMSFANGVSAFTTSPVDVAVVTTTGEVDASGDFACLESVQDPRTPPASKDSSHDCPATPFKWSGEQLSAFSPISISAEKGTASESLVDMPTIALSLRLGELANLSDDELLVGQVEAV